MDSNFDLKNKKSFNTLENSSLKLPSLSRNETNNLNNESILINLGN